MKKLILASLLLLFVGTTFSQKPEHTLHGKNRPSIKKDKLAAAKLTSDIIPGYPASWIAGYVSVKIGATCNGKHMEATGANETLSAEQKNILANADPGTDVAITIKYTSKNSVTDRLETSTMYYHTSAVPETEAQYPGGAEQMTQYLQETIINRLPELDPQGKIPLLRVVFTINEAGEISQAKVSNKLVDPKVEQLLLNAVLNMPKWKPAETAAGIKVQQEMEFSVGSKGGC
jgi:hypothetical protein